MKATLLVNLKIDNATIVAGRVFDDAVEVFPSYVSSNLDNPKVIKLTEGSITTIAPIETPKLNKKK